MRLKSKLQSCSETKLVKDEGRSQILKEVKREHHGKDRLYFRNADHYRSNQFR